MMMQCFVVWYRTPKLNRDIIVGAAHSWTKAKEMAEKLYGAKKTMDKVEELSTGVSLLEYGTLYMKQKPKGRWQVLPLMSVDTPSW